MNKVLEEHLKVVAILLKAYYESSKQMKAPVNLGILRERFAREFLRLFLPTTHEIQMGEIIDSNGNRTRQQDIVIYRRDMPKLRIIEEPAILFAEGAKATIEVKSKLTWGSFKDALENTCTVKQLQTKITKFAVGEKAGYIFKYIFAYGSSREAKIIEYYNKFAKMKKWTIEEFYTNVPDALYILDGPLFYKNDGYVFQKATNPDGSSPPYCLTRHPDALIKFFMHLAMSVSYPDIYTIDWKSYLE